MSNCKERAMELFKQGYNCSQAVLCAFCDELEIDFDNAMKISSSFGGGMGKLREVCGAVSGAFMVSGMKYGYTDPKDNKAKAEHYELIQKIATQFKEEKGSIICRELLGLDKSAEERGNFKKCPCGELVGYAAELLKNLTKEKKDDESYYTSRS